MHKATRTAGQGVRIHVLSYVVANLLQILVWWQFTPEQHFWPVWSILGWGGGLLAHIWSARAASRKLVGT
jgi:hypothetical protein